MKSSEKKFVFVIEKTKTGFSAYCKTYPIYTTGDNIAELYENALEALNLYFEKDAIKFKPENLNFEVDLQQFFTYYRVINAKFLAQRIGMNETLLSQYVKGHKKPSWKQSERILKGINEIGRELSEINLIFP